MVARVEIKINRDAIHCVGCEGRIESVLSQGDGILRVKANHRTQVVKVSLDADKVSESDVRARLEAMGYETLEE